MESLGTKDRREAEERCRLRLVEIDQLFREARDKLSGKQDRSAAREAQEFANFELSLGDSDARADELLAYEEREGLRAALRTKLRASVGKKNPAEIEVLLDMVDQKELASEPEREARQRKVETAWNAGAERAAKLFEQGLLGKKPQKEPNNLSGLFRAYLAERQPEPATVKRWTRVVEHLIRFLGHDDPKAVQREDLVRWKNHLLVEKDGKGKTRQATTVRETYVACAKVLFGYAFENGHAANNPASELTVRVPRKISVRIDKGFTEHEALTILRGTMAAPPPRLSEQHAAARRWVPWLCAYTGARVNEITQLRAEDVQMQDGVWLIHITPEAGSVKTGQARNVPLHSDLVSQGFVLFARGRKGPLFYDPAKGKGASAANPHYKKVGERLAAWVRDLGVDDPEVAPNHGWRHMLKTRARAAKFQDGAADALQGHAPDSEGQRYGDWPIKTLAEEIEKLPRFVI